MLRHTTKSSGSDCSSSDSELSDGWNIIDNIEENHTQDQDIQDQNGISMSLCHHNTDQIDKNLDYHNIRELSHHESSSDGESVEVIDHEDFSNSDESHDENSSFSDLSTEKYIEESSGGDNIIKTTKDSTKPDDPSNPDEVEIWEPLMEKFEEVFANSRSFWIFLLVGAFITSCLSVWTLSAVHEIEVSDDTAETPSHYKYIVLEYNKETGMYEERENINANEHKYFYKDNENIMKHQQVKVKTKANVVTVGKEINEDICVNRENQQILKQQFNSPGKTLVSGIDRQKENDMGILKNKHFDGIDARDDYSEEINEDTFINNFDKENEIIVDGENEILVDECKIIVDEENERIVGEEHEIIFDVENEKKVDEEHKIIIAGENDKKVGEEHEIIVDGENENKINEEYEIIIDEENENDILKHTDEFNVIDLNANMRDDVFKVNENTLLKSENQQHFNFLSNSPIKTSANDVTSLERQKNQNTLKKIDLANKLNSPKKDFITLKDFDQVKFKNDLHNLANVFKLLKDSKMSQNVKYKFGQSLMILDSLYTELNDLASSISKNSPLELKLEKQKFKVSHSVVEEISNVITKSIDKLANKIFTRVQKLERNIQTYWCHMENDLNKIKSAQSHFFNSCDKKERKKYTEKNFVKNQNKYGKSVRVEKEYSNQKSNVKNNEHYKNIHHKENPKIINGPGIKQRNSYLDKGKENKRNNKDRKYENKFKNDQIKYQKEEKNNVNDEKEYKNNKNNKNFVEKLKNGQSKYQKEMKNIHSSKEYKNSDRTQKKVEKYKSDQSKYWTESINNMYNGKDYKNIQMNEKYEENLKSGSSKSYKEVKHDKYKNTFQVVEDSITNVENITENWNNKDKTFRKHTKTIDIEINIDTTKLDANIIEPKGIKQWNFFIKDDKTDNQTILSGDWFLNSGDARSQVRWNHHRSDWVFERANARRNRKYGSQWFFQRAWAREQCRQNPSSNWCKSTIMTLHTNTRFR